MLNAFRSTNWKQEKTIFLLKRNDHNLELSSFKEPVELLIIVCTLFKYILNVIPAKTSHYGLAWVTVAADEAVS
jgi:hypothetical protein